MAFSKSSHAETNGIAVTTTGHNSSVNIIKNFAAMPSILTPLLQGIIDVYDPTDSIPDDLHISPEIEAKIKYNNVILFAEDIINNCGFMSMIECIIDSIDNQNPKSKDTFLWAIKQKYTRCKNTLLLDSKVNLSDSDAIKIIINNNADALIRDVSNELFKTVQLGNESSTLEIVIAAQQLIVCYGFINCKILEKPNDN